MKAKILLKKFSLAFLAAASIVSCSEYDDSDLWNEVNSIKDRVSNIESQLSGINQDIQSVHTLVNAIKDNVYIVSVTPTDDGYEIVMSNGKRFTIKNGRDGKDGYDGKDGQDGKDGKDGVDGLTPVIGVAPVDGVYYWTVTIGGKTEFLLDALGNKIPATGSGDGSVAPAPIIKVDYYGYWVISYDGGVTFDYIRDSSGNPVKAVAEGGDGLFLDVYQDGDYVVFVLTNGTIIRIKSCQCGNTPIEEVVPPEILEDLSPYMNIYYGTNPPVIEGTYFIDPFVTVYCQDQGNGGYDPGDKVNSEYVGFFNQDNKKLTLDFKAESVSGNSYEKGDGSFIAGDGNNFTVYFNTVGATQGISTKTALVISGTKTSGGIGNLQYAFVMVEKGSDPDHKLMEEGVFRVFKDQDGLSEKSSHTFNFAPAKAPGSPLSLWYDYIRVVR